MTVRGCVLFSALDFFLTSCSWLYPSHRSVNLHFNSSIVGILINNKLLSICVFFFNIFLHLISKDWNDLDLQRRWTFRWPWPHCESMHYLLERLNQINMCSHKINSWHITSYSDLSRGRATMNPSICKA